MNSTASPAPALQPIRQFLSRHPVALAAWVLVLVLLELFFWVLPPRGYIGTQVILLGCVRGEPLADFSTLWNRLVNDDAFMLSLLQEVNLPIGSTSQALEVLNREIRPGLKYAAETSSLIKISFHQPRAYWINPFLKVFSIRFLEKLNYQERETLLFRTGQVFANLMQLKRRAGLLENGFGLSFKDLAGNLLQSLDSGAMPTGSSTFQLHQTTSLLSDNIVSRWLKTVGYLALNELDAAIFRTQSEYDALANDDAPLLSLFPKLATHLSSFAAPPMPAQPNLFLFYLLLPVGGLFLALASLLLWELPLTEPNHGPER